MDLPEQAQFESAFGDDTRVTARESIFIGAIVCFDGDSHASPARVRNISSGGMMIDTAIVRPQGMVVAADLKQVGRITGHVAWSTEKRTGIVFDTAIDPTQVRQKPDPAVAQPTFKRFYHETGRPPLKAR